MKTAATRFNLRSHQRVDVTIEATLNKSDGTTVISHVANLSRAGMMIECDAATAKQLIPGNKPPAPGNWINVTASFAIPVIPQQPVAINAEGHIVHLRRISRNLFQVGVQFQQFADNGFEYLDRYVSRQLCNAG